MDEAGTEILRTCNRHRFPPAQCRMIAQPPLAEAIRHGHPLDPG